MARNNEHYQAGGGNTEFQKLRKNPNYKNYGDDYIRRLVEQKGKRALAGPRGEAARALSDEDAFKAGGGNAALENLRSNYQYRNQSDDFLRGLVAQRGRRAVSQGPANPAPVLSETDKQVSKDNKQYGNTFPEGSFGITKNQIKINQNDPDTPSEPVVETTESDTLAASEVTKPPSQRELLIKESRTKYKDSPFKQWAHANQKLAMALKPGQVGYAQVQEYFKEQKSKLKVKPQEKPFIKPNATKVQMGPGANDLRGYSSTIA